MPHDWTHDKASAAHVWLLLAGVFCELLGVLFRWSDVAALAGVLLMVSGAAAAVAGDSVFAGLTDHPSEQGRVAAASASILVIVGGLLLGTGVSGSFAAPLPPAPEPASGIPLPIPR